MESTLTPLSPVQRMGTTSVLLLTRNRRHQEPGKAPHGNPDPRLDRGDDGNVYGVGGEDFGVGRLFTYKPEPPEFVDLGMMDVSIVPYFEWKGLVFDSMVTGPGLSIYIGNSEHRSRLFVYNP